MEQFAAEVRNMTPLELQGVRRICAALTLFVDALLEAADDSAPAGT